MLQTIPAGHVDLFRSGTSSDTMASAKRELALLSSLPHTFCPPIQSSSRLARYPTLLLLWIYAGCAFCSPSTWSAALFLMMRFVSVVMLQYASPSSPATHRHPTPSWRLTARRKGYFVPPAGRTPLSQVGHLVVPQPATPTGGDTLGHPSWAADTANTAAHPRAAAQTVARRLLQAVHQRSRLGPKSQGCTSAFSSLRGSLCFAVIFLSMLFSASATDARVLLPAHHGSIEANFQPSSFPNSGAKPHGDWSHISRRQGNTQPIRKRAFLRALRRAQNNEHHTTTYRGRTMHLNQVSRPSDTRPQGKPADHQPNHNRLRIVTWNSGGLASHTYREVLTWLQLEHEAKRTVDICILQETAWQEDLEYSTSFQGPTVVNWHVVHASGKDRTGLLCMIRKGLVQADQIRTNSLVPGRLLHVRLLFRTPLDILCIYQHSWNLQNSALKGANKQEALLKLRRRVWVQIDKWLSSMPQRHGCLMVGDYNVTIHTEDRVCGEGIPDQGQPHPDQGELMDVLRAHRCCVLNTWSRRGLLVAPSFRPKQTTGSWARRLTWWSPEAT